MPLVISGPGRIRPGVSRVPVSALDLAPTICDFAGAVPPPSLPGTSLRGILDGDKPERFVFCELAADSKRPEIQGRMARGPRYKYCAYAPGTNSEQLFDLSADPGETRNLAGDSAHRAALGEHRAALAEWCASTNDPFAKSLAAIVSR